MGHYAFLDENNIVTEVITGRNEDEVVDGVSDWEQYYGDFRGQRCLRTSYNGNIRKRFAQIGYRYDEEADCFIPPRPFPSWELNSELEWVAPKPYPDDDTYLYDWDEYTTSWVATNAWNEESSQWTQIP